MKAFLQKHYPAIILFLFSFLAYGLMIPWLGFYWDDWPMAWFAKTLGPLGLVNVLATDRPFLTGIYMITTSILPIKPIYWQIFALLVRWLCGFSVYWMLTQLWPKLKKEMLWVAILFTIFPGFKQQPIALIYGNALVLLASFFFSLGLMIRAFQHTGKQKALLTAASIILQCFTIFSTEYYAGQELLRILIIWFYFNLDIRNFKTWFKTMFIEYLPYAIGLLAFFIWRVFIFKFPTYKPVSINELSQGPYPNIIMYLNRMVQDVYLAVWGAWSQIFKFPDLSKIVSSSDIAYWALVLLSLPVIYLLFRSIQKGYGTKDKTFPIHKNHILIFAFAAIILGAVPYWATNLPIQLQYPYDRFFLSLMFGSSILAVYAIVTFIKGKRTRLVLLSLLIAFSCGEHLLNANTYRREWDIQKDFFWQLYWRVPALQENTVMMTETFPLQYYSDNSLTAPLNWIYDNTTNHDPLKYLMVFTDIRLGGSLPSLKPGTNFTKAYRSTYFKGNTNQTVGYFYTTDACLHILDPQLSHDDPLLPESLNQISKLSDPSRILLAPAVTLDTSLFGKEPVHNWCYYYEKADLARQYQDWSTVIELADSANTSKLKAKAGSEYLPFSEAYAANGDWETSMKYIRKAYNMDKQLEKKLCDEVTRYQELYSADAQPNQYIVDEMLNMNCP